MTVAAAELQEGNRVTLRLGTGASAEVSAFALRDACMCAECRHPVSGQRLFESLEVVPSSQISTVRVEQGALAVEWSDGHRNSFDATALNGSKRSTDEHALWGAELDVTAVTDTFANVCSDARARRRWLERIARYGFAVLTGAPVEDGTVARVVELFGYVRETNYGRVFDVSVRIDATNLADTALALSLHTDNAYRRPVPTLQLLHCLSASVAGGDTVLADGFRAVERLTPDQRARLAAQPIEFAYRDATAELVAEVPVISLDASGAPTAVRINNRSKGVPVGRPAEVAAWYEAYFALLALLEAPDAKVVFRLEPGDVVTMDNERVLHARTGFSGAGERRLQGCYADRDALLSSLAVLGREASA